MVPICASKGELLKAPTLWRWDVALCFELSAYFWASCKDLFTIGLSVAALRIVPPQKNSISRVRKFRPMRPLTSAIAIRLPAPAPAPAFVFLPVGPLPRPNAKRVPPPRHPEHTRRSRVRARPRFYRASQVAPKHSAGDPDHRVETRLVGRSQSGEVQKERPTIRIGPGGYAGLSSAQHHTAQPPPVSSHNRIIWRNLPVGDLDLGRLDFG